MFFAVLWLLWVFPPNAKAAESCFHTVNPNENQKLLKIVKNKSIEGFPCKQWSEMAFGDYDEDYMDISDNNCRTLRPHGETHGPWCFVGRALKETVPEWQPCFPSCQDLKMDDNPSFCYWPQDYLKSELNYNGKKSQAHNAEDVSTLVSCSPWPNEYLPDETVESTLCRARKDASNANWIIPWCFYEVNETRLHRGNCFIGCDIQLQYKKELPDSEICIPRKRIREERLDTMSNFGCRYQFSINNFRCKSDQTTEISPQIFKQLGPYCELENPNLKKEPCYDHCEDRVNNALYDRTICVGLDKLLSYRGTRRKSLSNKECLHWLDPALRNWINQSGSNVWRQLRAPEDWMAVNFCRNPDANLDGPWCFVKDKTGEPKREFCFKHCRFGYEPDRETETSADNETRNFEEILEALRRNGTLRDSDQSDRIDIKKYVIYVGSVLGGFVVLYIVVIVIGIFSYEWISARRIQEAVECCKTLIQRETPGWLGGVPRRQNQNTEKTNEKLRIKEGSPECFCPPFNNKDYRYRSFPKISLPPPPPKKTFSVG